jgi:hypothetical protein
MLDSKTVLDVLESDFQAIEAQLGSQWTEFGRRGGDLADRFKAVAGKDEPKAAARALELAVNRLLKICWDYQYIGELLDQAEEASPELGPGTEGTKRPPSPDEPDIVEVKEIANRYYSLLARLKETADQKKEDANDRRTRP